MNQVYVCGTYFHVYVSVLKALYGKKAGIASMLVVNDLTPQIEQILDALQSTGYFHSVIQVPFKDVEKRIKKEKSFIGRVFNRNHYVMRYTEMHSSIDAHHAFISSAEINLFPDLGLTPAYFTLKYPNNFFRMIEEGEGAYFLRVGKFKEFKRRHILRTFVGGGLDENIKEIEVQHPEKLNPRVKAKGKRLELKKMVSDLNEDERSTIMKVFAGDMAMDFSARNKKLLLITQPLEETFMTESKKIDLYNQILEKYSTDYSIFLKPHPREHTVYKNKLICPFTLIPNGFPLELFDLLPGLHFDLGVTICSSALYNLACVEKKVIFGRQYLKDPLPENWFELYSQ